MSLETASIAQHAKTLRLPAVAAQFASLADEAAGRNHSHLHYLEALLHPQHQRPEGWARTNRRSGPSQVAKVIPKRDKRLAA